MKEVVTLKKKIDGRILFLREFGFGCLDCVFVLLSFFLFFFTFTFHALTQIKTLVAETSF